MSFKTEDQSSRIKQPQTPTLEHSKPDLSLEQDHHVTGMKEKKICLKNVY